MLEVGGNNFAFRTDHKGVCMSARKVYWKGLELTLQLSKRYIQRNQLKLQANLTTEQYACVVSTLNAILACLELLPSNEPT
jgi:hypothetical protein